jgi:hypothetical protein
MPKGTSLTLWRDHQSRPQRALTKNNNPSFPSRKKKGLVKAMAEHAPASRGRAKSLLSLQSLHGVDDRGPARWEIACERSSANQ